MPIETDRQATLRIQRERKEEAQRKLQAIDEKLKDAQKKAKRSEVEEKEEIEQREVNDKKEKALRQKRKQRKNAAKLQSGKKGSSLEERKKIDRERQNKKRNADLDDFIVPEGELEESQEEEADEAESKKVRTGKRKNTQKPKKNVNKTIGDRGVKMSELSDDVENSDGGTAEVLEAAKVSCFSRDKMIVKVIFPGTIRSSLSCDVDGDSSPRSSFETKKKKKKKKNKKNKENKTKHDSLINVKNTDNENDDDDLFSSDEDENQNSSTVDKKENCKKLEHNRNEPSVLETRKIATPDVGVKIISSFRKRTDPHLNEKNMKPNKDFIALSTDQEKTDSKPAAKTSETKTLQTDETGRNVSNEHMLQSIKRKLTASAKSEKVLSKSDGNQIVKDEIKQKASKIPKKNNKKVTPVFSHSMDSSVKRSREHSGLDADNKNNEMAPTTSPTSTIPLVSQKKRSSQFSSSKDVSPKMDGSKLQNQSNFSSEKSVEIPSQPEEGKKRKSIIISAPLEKKLRNTIIRGLREELEKLFERRSWIEEKEKFLDEFTTHGIDWSGSFCVTSNSKEDFFDTDENNNIMYQPEIPIFPEDFPDRKPTHPLRWWGIEEPPIELIEAARLELQADKELKKLNQPKNLNTTLPLTRPPPPDDILNMPPPLSYVQNASNHPTPRHTLHGPPPRDVPPPPQHFQNPPPPFNHQHPPPNHVHHVNNQNHGNWNDGSCASSGPPSLFNCPPPRVLGSNGWSQGGNFPPPPHQPGGKGAGDQFQSRKPHAFQQQSNNNYQGHQQQDNHGW